MIYISYIIFILVLLVDLLFYIPIKINIYFDKNAVYIYLYSLAIIAIDEKRNINLLKNKISIDQILNAETEDLKMIEAFKIEKINISIDQISANQNAQLIYPFVSLNYFTKIIDFKIKNESKLYVRASVTFVNILHELIIIRRIKQHERKSHKRNT